MMSNNQETLFVRSIPNACKLAVLNDFFSSILEGEFEIKKGKSKGKNKPGHALITVHSERDRRTLLEGTLVLQGAELSIQRYKTPKDLFLEASDMLQKRVYINNLPFDATMPEVKQLFSQFGGIQNIFMKPKIAEGEEEVRAERRFIKSYVNFNKIEEAKKCLQAVPIYFKGHKLHLYQKLTPKNRLKETRLTKFPQAESKVSTSKFIYHDELIKNNFNKNPDPYHLPETRFLQGRIRSRNVFRTSEAIPKRSREGRFQIEPFKPMISGYSDWMNNQVECYFSFKDILPLPLGAASIARRNYVKECGYNHSFSNLRMNKAQ